ncbi:MAG: DUF3267 domain-containing protein [Eggerthellaceae bacterium]|nr:DUF3267 domain-containing protein [Eggerthellaceae bacterium]
MGAKKERKLTDAEVRRLEAFSATCDALVSQGYKRIGLEVGILFANVVAIVAAVVLFLVSIPLFAMAHPETDIILSSVGFIIVIIAFLVLIVVHELIHGITWSFFAPNGFKNIEFGIMRDSFTPYCTCNAPLRKGAYVIGALMPLIILGIAPLAIAFIVGNVPLLFIGILMTVAAAGDVLIVLKVLRHKAVSDDTLLFDHPTEAGSVIFER